MKFQYVDLCQQKSFFWEFHSLHLLSQIFHLKKYIHKSLVQYIGHIYWSINIQGKLQARPYIAFNVFSGNILEVGISAFLSELLKHHISIDYTTIAIGIYFANPLHSVHALVLLPLLRYSGAKSPQYLRTA